jgi:hypothetical protein
LPGDQSGLVWKLLPFGLAQLFALGAGVAKGVMQLITLAAGAVAGWAIVMNVLGGLSGLGHGVLAWVLAPTSTVLGAAYRAGAPMGVSVHRGLSKRTFWTARSNAAFTGPETLGIYCRR